MKSAASKFISVAKKLHRDPLFFIQWHILLMSIPEPDLNKSVTLFLKIWWGQDLLKMVALNKELGEIDRSHR